MKTQKIDIIKLYKLFFYIEQNLRFDFTYKGLIRKSKKITLLWVKQEILDFTLKSILNMP